MTINCLGNTSVRRREVPRLDFESDYESTRVGDLHRPFDEDFYVVEEIAPAVLLQQTAPVISLPEFTLEEVLAGMPWKRERETRI